MIHKCTHDVYSVKKSPILSSQVVSLPLWLQLVSKWFIVFINTHSFKQVTSCSMHSIVTTFRGADIKVEVANFCAAMDTLIDQDESPRMHRGLDNVT